MSSTAVPSRRFRLSGNTKRQRTSLHGRTPAGVVTQPGSASVHETASPTTVPGRVFSQIVASHVSPAPHAKQIRGRSLR